ncbi:MAG: hypothetical protein ACFKPT_21425 [Gloeotrichia echinulata GP01]
MEALDVVAKTNTTALAFSTTLSVGLLLALRHGIFPEATTRPISPIKPIFL